VAGFIADAGPIIVPLLVPAFSKSRDAEVGRALAQALARSPGAESIAADDLNKLLKNFPGDAQSLAGPLREKLAARQHEQAGYLAQLTSQLLATPGNAERGRAVFFSKKVGCYACHRAAGQGGNVGPDLSQVGRFRSSRDLLEAVVFPSSTIVPAYRSYAVATRDGRVTSGMIVRETSDAIDLRTAQLAEIRIPTQDIAEMSPSAASIMPDGLEKTITPQELSDLLEFLYQQR
jgi:putative heme-binding domain-containing protein